MTVRFDTREQSTRFSRWLDVIAAGTGEDWHLWPRSTVEEFYSLWQRLEKPA